MNEIKKMFLVLVLTSASCGLLLASVYELSKEQIIIQKLKYTKGPALNALLKDFTNDPLKEKKEIFWKGMRVNLFIGKKGNKIESIAIETFSNGYGGKMEVLTAFDINNNSCKGVAITEHRETVGIGAKVTEPFFTEQFKGLTVESKIAIKSEDGVIDGISGATISSRAVCKAVAEAMEIYKSYSDSLEKVLNNERVN